MKTIFEYKSYRAYLKAYFAQYAPRSGHKSQFCLAINCQSSFLSLVINKQAHLTQEQAISAAKFLKLDTSEEDFFMLLLQKARAGTQDLKNFYQTKIDNILQDRMNIHKRIQVKSELSIEAQNQYYSHWLYSALHILVSIPSKNNKFAASEHLKIPIEQVEEILNFLETEGLLIKDLSGKYSFGPSHIHLSNESNNIYKHHTNWRLRALQSLDSLQNKKNLHYAVTYTLAKKDSLVLKERFLELIQNNLKLIEPSPEEVMYCNVIDFFEV